MAGHARCGTSEDRLTAADDPLLEVALRAALAGGEAVMRVYAEPFDVTHKDDKTPVTEADLASERVIVAMLSEAFPEEQVAVPGPDDAVERLAARGDQVPLDGRPGTARRGTK